MRLVGREECTCAGRGEGLHVRRARRHSPSLLNSSLNKQQRSGLRRKPCVVSSFFFFILFFIFKFDFSSLIRFRSVVFFFQVQLYFIFNFFFLSSFVSRESRCECLSLRVRLFQDTERSGDGNPGVRSPDGHCVLFVTS